MSIQWNKVTWYSKLLAIIVFLATFYIAFQLGEQTAYVHMSNSAVQMTLSSTRK